MRPIVWGVCAFLALLVFPAITRADRIPPDLPADLSSAGSPTSQPPSTDNPFSAAEHQLPDLSKRENFSSAMQIIVLLTVLSLAPAILLMMTSFTRIIIVLALLRQALGTQQLPPNQILIGLAMFMTFLVMGPTWQRVNDNAPSALYERKDHADRSSAAGGAAGPRIHDQPDQAEP